MTRKRYRIRFSKTGPLRWIGHLDLIRMWERLLRRAGLKLAMTEGFHPKPKMSFPTALALGAASVDEVMELELVDELSEADLQEILQSDAQPGLEILCVSAVPEGVGKAQAKSTSYNFSIPDSESETIRQRIAELLTRDTIEIIRKEKAKTFEVHAVIQQLELDGSTLSMRLAAGQQASLKPTDVIELLGLTHLIDDGHYLTRTKVELEIEIDSTPRVREKQTS